MWKWHTGLWFSDEHSDGGLTDGRGHFEVFSNPRDSRI